MTTRMTGYFDPMPKSGMNMQRVHDYVQRNVDTFYRNITFTGDVTVNGFFRTAASGQRIEIRPSGTEGGLVPSIAFFTGASFGTNEPFIEAVDLGSGVWALRLSAPSSGTAAQLDLQSNNEIHADSPFFLGAVDGTNEGGELVFIGSGAFSATDMSVDRFQDSLRVLIDSNNVAQFTDTDGHNLQGLAWTTWEPTLTNITAGSGTTVARYVRIGNVVIVRFSFTLGAGSAIGTGPRVSPPIQPTAPLDTVNGIVGNATLIDPGNASYPAVARLTGTAPNRDFIIEYQNAAGTALVQASVTATVPFAWGSGDILTFDAMYEVA